MFKISFHVKSYEFATHFESEKQARYWKAQFQFQSSWTEYSLNPDYFYFFEKWSRVTFPLGHDVNALTLEPFDEFKKFK